LYEKFPPEIKEQLDKLRYVSYARPTEPAPITEEDKKRILEDIDKYFFGSLLEWIDLRNTIIVVTCDHTTSCEQKAHTADPVPLVVVGPNIVPDNVAGFNERVCVQGALKRVSAISLMPALVKLANR
jgi:2,3-bisphosphoglycerate-independent phosphoglycerate mutase